MLPNKFPFTNLRFPPPTEGDIKDTSKETVLLFLNTPRFLSAVDCILGWGDRHGERSRAADPLRDELRDDAAECMIFEFLKCNQYVRYAARLKDFYI